MTKIGRWGSILAIFTAAFVTQAAFSAEAGGTWISDSGNVFIIPPPGNSNKFDIILEPAKGKKELLQAEWVSQMKGSQFMYLSVDKKTWMIATFEWYTGKIIRVHPVTDARKGNFWKRK